jgi:DNA-binding transcriptional LysR family regulator
MFRWPPDISLLKALVSVAEEGSFAKAAPRLGITPQAVGGQVRKLETFVERRLVDRTTHASKLTADGEAMVIYARMMLDVAEAARRHFAAGKLDGTIRLGVIEACANTGLVLALRQLRQISDRLEIITRTAETKVLLGYLEAGSIDIMVGTQRAGDRKGEVLFRDPLRWVGQSDALHDPGKPVPLVLHTEASVLRAITLEALAEAGRSWTVVFETDSRAGIQAAVNAGLGISATSRFRSGMANEPAFLVDHGLPSLADTEIFMAVRPRSGAYVESFADILRIVGPALARIESPAGDAQ